MAYVIGDECISCGACEGECPVGAISEGDGKYVIDADTCASCGACAAVCPVGALHPPRLAGRCDPVVRLNRSPMNARWIAREGPVAIREMQNTEHDFRLMLRWMTDPQTMRYWEGMQEIYTYERVAREYAESLAEGVTPCIIAYAGTEIGYCQFCTLSAEIFEVPEEEYAKFARPEDCVYGIDIFLGEVEYRDRGIGTACLKALMRALFETYGADALMIDPKTHNARAIRCYRKCGFRDLFVVPQREWQDGEYHDSLIMGARKAGFDGGAAAFSPIAHF